MSSRHLVPQRGFSLIEAVVSIALIGIILIASAALVRGIPLSSNARDEDIALKIASSKIDSLRALGYEALPPSGTFTDPILNSLASSTASTTVSSFNAKMKRVDVTVSWVARDKVPHSTTLTTLITQVGGL